MHLEREKHFSTTNVPMVTADKAQDIWRCSPTRGCNWYSVCTRPCPDSYSCNSLYGAYGPYGGVSYWGGYTDSGWSHYR